MRMRNFLLPLLILLTVALYAQNQKPSFLYEQIQQKHRENAVFQSLSLFRESSAREHSEEIKSVVDSAKLLTIDKGESLRSYAKAAENIFIEVPYLAGQTFSLEMSLVDEDPANKTEMGVIENGVPRKVDYQGGKHYRGIVKGNPHSFASMSIFNDGTVMGLFSMSEGNFVIGKLKNSDSEYILYNDHNFRVQPPMSCATAEKDIDESIVPEPNTRGLLLDPPPTICKVIRVYWEADYNLYNFNFNNNLQNTQNYLTGLFNQMATMYQNEGILVELSATYVWTTNDPYRRNNSNNALTDFKSRWNGMGNNFDGTLAHLIAGRSLGNGGVAYLDVLCSRSFAYAYSNVDGNYQIVPTYSWDVMVVTHETGHNIGSSHTHWCGWRTAPGNACGSIDNCYTQESGAGCTTCPFTYDKNVSGWQGTVMSYCHLTQRGINLSNGFGPLPQAVIRAEVSGASCISGSGQINPTITATPNPICQGNDLALSSSGGNTYSWSGPNGFSSNEQNPFVYSINTNQAGTYRVTVTGSSGCTGTKTISVTVRPSPTASITPNGSLSFCEGGTVRLDANTGTGFSYQWKKDDSDLPGAVNPFYVATESGLYTVVVTNSSGCSSVAPEIMVDVSPLPQALIFANGPVTFCEGNFVALIASNGSGYSYQWRLDDVDIPGANSSTYLAYESGHYSVEIRNPSQCYNVSNIINVTANPLPDAEVIPMGPTSFCVGGSVLLSATPGVGLNYIWRKNSAIIPGANMANYNATEAGTYTVQVTNSNNCSATSTPVIVTIFDRPQAVINPHGPTTFCQGDSVLLDANTGLTGVFYQWRKGGVNIQGATSPGYIARDTGSYSVRVYTSNDCSSISTELRITINPSPSSSISTQGLSPICEGDSVILIANTNNGNSYQWQHNDTDIPGATAPNFIAKSDGLYTVIISNQFNCYRESQAFALTVNPAPDVVITSQSGFTACQGSTLNLDAGVFTQSGYHWNTGSDTRIIQVNETGDYSVTVTSGAGCSAVSSVHIDIYPKPNLAINPGLNATFCTGGSVLLAASGGASYQWTGGATTSEIRVSQEGTYTVTVTTDHDCSAVASITVTESNQLTVSLNGPDTLCKGQSVTLTPGSGFSDYAWSDGTENASITVDKSGAYSVTVSDQSGCTGIASANIVVLDTAFTSGFTVADTVNEFSQTIISITPQAGWTYHWEVTGGTIVDGQDSPSVTIQWGDSGEGKIVLVATNQGLCEDIIISNVVIGKHISTNNPDVKNPYIYPNPAREYLYVKQIPDNSYRYNLLDATGRLMESNTLVENQYISTAKLPSGVYFLKCYSDGSNARFFVFKFVKTE